tara:strand:+ start:793 stop:1302 length:510 start_codon:yes stop_codon:yes gene_type:complete
MIIDNFLPKENLKFLQQTVMWNHNFPFNLHNDVAKNSDGDNLDNWYGTSLVYYNSKPVIEFYEDVNSIFKDKIQDFGAWLRIKVNFYPHTAQIYEHKQHYDYDFSHGAAIFCLNTCDGYTKIGEDIKIESIANRFYIFDGLLPHNSTTTTNTKGRFNINFNYLKVKKLL